MPVPSHSLNPCHSQANLEEDKRLRGQDTPRSLGRESGCRDPEPECSNSEASANEEEQEAEPMESIPEAQVPDLAPPASWGLSPALLTCLLPLCRSRARRPQG